MATPDYGKDISCTDRYDPVGRYVSGSQALMQAVYRRLTTPRGSVPRAPNYGLDLRSFMSIELTRAAMAAIPAQIEQEVLKDERIESVKVVIAAHDARSLTLTVTCSGALGPFRLTLVVSAVTVALLKSEVL